MDDFMTEHAMIVDQRDQRFEAEQGDRCDCNFPSCYDCKGRLEAEEDGDDDGDRGFSDELFENAEFEGADEFYGDFGGDDF